MKKIKWLQLYVSSLIVCVSLHAVGSVIYIENASITEGDEGKSMMEFQVIHTLPASVPVTIYYDTSDVSAKAGVDYVSSGGEVVIPPGGRKAIIKVPILNNRIKTQANRTFRVTIASSFTVISPFATGTIIENDTGESHVPVK